MCGVPKPLFLKQPVEKLFLEFLWSYLVLSKLVLEESAKHQSIQSKFVFRIIFWSNLMQVYLYRSFLFAIVDAFCWIFHKYILYFAFVLKLFTLLSSKFLITVRYANEKHISLWHRSLFSLLEDNVFVSKWLAWTLW